MQVCARGQMQYDRGDELNKSVRPCLATAKTRHGQEPPRWAVVACAGGAVPCQSCADCTLAGAGLIS